MRIASYGFGLITSLYASSAFATPATQAGADALIAVFQTYLGTSAGVVGVRPTGESYDVKLDFAALSAKLPDGKATISPIRMQLTDNGDGTWGVTQDQSFSLAISVPGKMDVAYDNANMSFAGTFDTALRAFSTATSDMTDMTVKQAVTLASATPQGTTQHLEACIQKPPMLQRRAARVLTAPSHLPCQY